MATHSSTTPNLVRIETHDGRCVGIVEDTNPKLTQVEKALRGARVICRGRGKIPAPIWWFHGRGQHSTGGSGLALCPTVLIGRRWRTWYVDSLKKVFLFKESLIGIATRSPRNCDKEKS